MTGAQVLAWAGISAACAAVAAGLLGDVHGQAAPGAIMLVGNVIALIVERRSAHRGKR